MKLLKQLEMKKNLSSGFTLIELLVVIGVLGILAAALLATIDPIEQFRKASDANYKEAGASLGDALHRFFATRQAYPWEPGVIVPPDPACANPYPSTTVTINGPSFMRCVTELISYGELKPSYTASAQYTSGLLFVYNGSLVAGIGTIRVCFDPVSKAENRNPFTKFTNAGDAAGTCDNRTNPACLWCAQ